MAPTPPPAEAGGSAIEGLPAELLEMAFLYAVDEIVPPKATSSDHDKVSRLRHELETGVSSTVQALQFRLVCRKFRDTSWRALGKLIEVTTFDFASRRSIHNFQCIANLSDLTAWIKQVTFTCNVADESWPSQILPGPLDMRQSQELEKVVQEDKAWSPELFNECDLNSLNDTPEIESFVGIIDSAIQQFSHLHKVSYFWNGTLPASRSRDMLRGNSSDHWQEDLEPRCNHRRAPLGAHLGLYILVKTLANAHIQPYDLDLAVELRDPHAFIALNSHEVLLYVFEKVESLTIRDRYYPVCELSSQHAAEPRAILTKSLFPALRSLTVDHHAWGLDAPLSFPTESELPNLTHITIVDGDASDPYMALFLAHYGKNIQSLSIENMRIRDLAAIGDIVKYIDLEVLSLKLGRDEDWEKARERFEKLGCSNRDLTKKLQTAASTVVLEPPMLKVFIECLPYIEQE